MKGSCLGVFGRFIEKSQQEQIVVSEKRWTGENEHLLSIGEDKIIETSKVLMKRAKGTQKKTHGRGV
jgi:hypothetical protein